MWHPGRYSSLSRSEDGHDLGTPQVVWSTATKRRTVKSLRVQKRQLNVTSHMPRSPAASTLTQAVLAQKAVSRRSSGAVHKETAASQSSG
ncbi:hypothetical protein TYRP_023193 [Tyrophagus putrescentiae]|nr:hypothetical protein TYRP_023193 [Tyrophagus putrescentiae]